MFIVVDELARIGIERDRCEISGDEDGVSAIFDTLEAAADHLVWLEKEWLNVGDESSYRIYRTVPQDVEHAIAEARKRAGAVDSAEGKPVPPSVYEKIAALIVSELRDLEGEEQVSRAVYEDLVSQNQTLTEKIGDLEETNRMLSAEPDKWRKAHYAKCLELEAELDRVDKVRKALDEE